MGLFSLFLYIPSCEYNLLDLLRLRKELISYSGKPGLASSSHFYFEHIVKKKEGSTLLLKSEVRRSLSQCPNHFIIKALPSSLTLFYPISIFMGTWPFLFT